MDTYSKANQLLTLETATAVGNEWTSAEIRSLRELKTANVPVAEIAQQLGRTYYGVSTKLGALGLTVVNPNRKTKITKTEIACAACWIIHNGDCA
jgi:hypothetical protein